MKGKNILFLCGLILISNAVVSCGLASVVATDVADAGAVL